MQLVELPVRKSTKRTPTPVAEFTSPAPDPKTRSRRLRRRVEGRVIAIGLKYGEIFSDDFILDDIVEEEVH